MNSALSTRITSFKDNVITLAPLMNGYVPSLRYILSTMGQSNIEQTVQHKDLKLTFRRRDLTAVREILQAGEYDFLADIIKDKKEPFIYDLGAHIGLFAFRMLAVNPTAKIFSLEASPATYEILEKNLAANKTACPNWVIKNGAAWKNNDHIKFAASVENTMSHRVDKNGEVNVPGITYKEIITQHSAQMPICVMKIDIEGAEEAFLCGADLDFSNVENLIIELHPDHCDTTKVRAVLEKHFTIITEKHDPKLSKPLLLCQHGAAA